MAPTFTDFVLAMRRLWWVPLSAILVGVGLGMLTAHDAHPTTETSTDLLFTFRVENAGVDSAGAARGAEAQVAHSRLSGYVQLAQTSPQVSGLLARYQAQHIADPSSPSASSPSPSVTAQIALSESGLSPGTSVLPGAGLVGIRVRSTGISEADAVKLVTDLSTEVARVILATDAQQEAPSLRSDPLIAQPQASAGSASASVKLALPVLLLTTLGVGLTYVIVWRQGRIHTRRDIEERLGALVLGELTGGPADLPAIVLALTRGREPGTRALIVHVEPSRTKDGGALGAALARAGIDLGLAVSLATLSPERPQVPANRTGPSHSSGIEPGVDLRLIETVDGLDVGALLAAGAVDVVMLVAVYETTSYRRLTAAARTLAEVTDAHLAVLGVHRRAARLLAASAKPQSTGGAESG